MPIGVKSSIQKESISLTGMVASIDGKTLIKDNSIGSLNEPEKIGIDLARKLIDQGADKILAEIFKEFREK